jgi:cytochrome c biogenesis protein CcmG/thiol:disulfide interchange protein DsbE
MSTVKKKHTLRWVSLGVATVLVAFAVLLASQVHSDPSFTGGKLLDKPVPEFDLPSLTGSARVSSAGLEGKVYLVNFWNSWCIPCNEEHGALAQFYAQHENDPNFALVGIVRDDTASAARQYVDQHKDPWTFVTDPQGQASIDFGTTGQPESYMIDAQGVVRAVFRSPVTVTDLDEMLAAAQQA